MATPLKLKSERVGKTSLAHERPYLSVLVDTGVYHLDQTYDYSLPAKYEIEAGNWVSVPFNGQNCQGLVVERKESASTGKVLPINRAIKGPYISKAHLDLYLKISERWAVPIFDVLRFVLRNQIKSVHKTANSDKVATRQYLQLAPNEDEATQVHKFISKIAKSGPTLLVIPENRNLVHYQHGSIDVGLRGSILNSNSYKNVVILREDSEHHYELKSPGFNTRDVALLRGQELNENLYFIGFSPSLEMMRLIEIGYVTLRKASGKVKVVARPSQMGELIPSNLLKEIRAAIGKGPILVLAPNKGYGLAISCAACRNIAKCKCGGKLTKRSKSSAPTCVLCSALYEDWRCTFCGKADIYLLGRGIERIAEEFGRSFANTAIHIATAEKEISGEVSKRSIILATVGAAPTLDYGLVLILEGMLNSADLRSEERFLSMAMRHAALAKGNVAMVERDENPFVNALIRWNPISLLSKILHEMQQNFLPPTTRYAILKPEPSEVDRIYGGLLASVREGRLPAGVSLHLLDSGVISLFFSHKEAEVTVRFLKEFQRKRSIAGKRILQMRIDPYLLG